LPLLTFAAFLLSLKLQQKKYKLLPFAGLIIGLGLHIHFTVIFLVLFFLIAVIMSKPKKENYKELTRGTLISIFIILISLLPLILFDLKHQFMNTKLLLNFFLQGEHGFYFNLGESFRVYRNSFDLLNLFESFDGAAYFSILAVLFSILSAYLFDKKNFKTVLLWIVSPLLFFSFYRGNISEYYFTISVCVVILYSGLFFSRISKNFYIIFSCLLLFSLFHLKTIITFENIYGLYYQKQLIYYLNNQSTDPKFNLSYDLNLSWDVPFEYLLKKSPKHTTTNEGHLYTVVSYDKDPQSMKFGGFGLVRR
jgi:hypothetical protein